MTKAKIQPPGSWKKGESGNPAGRKPGTGKVAELRASIADHIAPIISQLIAQAKDGDVQAARLILERVLPPVKPIEQTQVIDMPMEGTLTEKANAVLHAAAIGELAPSQAAQLLTALGTVSKIVEIDELEVRISKLEERNAK